MKLEKKWEVSCMYDKERIHDEKIEPLMNEIIKICKDNNIQMLATFMLKEDDDIAFTSYIPSTEYNNTRLEQAFRIILGWEG